MSLEIYFVAHGVPRTTGDDTESLTWGILEIEQLRDRDFEGHFGLSDGEGELAASRARDDGVSRRIFYRVVVHISNQARYNTARLVPSDGDGCTHINLNILFGARTRRHHLA